MTPAAPVSPIPASSIPVSPAKVLPIQAPQAKQASPAQLSFAHVPPTEQATPVYTPMTEAPQAQISKILAPLAEVLPAPASKVPALLTLTALAEVLFRAPASLVEVLSTSKLLSPNEHRRGKPGKYPEQLIIFDAVILRDAEITGLLEKDVEKDYSKVVNLNKVVISEGI